MYNYDIIYTRVSTDEQTSNSSLDDQERSCREYLAKLGYQNIKVFREDYSGFSFNRPELDEIKNLITSGQVRSLTFLRVDRLSRSVAHLDELRQRFFIFHYLDADDFTKTAFESKRVSLVDQLKAHSLELNRVQRELTALDTRFELDYSWETTAHFLSIYLTRIK